MPLERGAGCEALAGSLQVPAMADPMVRALLMWVGLKMLRKTLKFLG